jgi:glycosyltransferase involved in cell wall biosynthesis
MKMYQLFNFPKSYLDFVTWPMSEIVVQSIDGFLAVSEFTREFMRTHLPQLKDVPIEVVPNPVMIPEPSITPKNPEDSFGRKVLYASGSSIDKGPHIALYATRKLLDEGPNEFTLTMLGVEGNAWIRGLVRRLHVEKHVRLLSRLPRTQACALMADSAVVLVPSVSPESFGRIPIEANLLGTPVVVSNRGALPNTIVDKVTGLVTEPSVDTFAKSMDDALRADWNRELIMRTTKRRFDPERIADDFVHFLEKFI